MVKNAFIVITILAVTVQVAANDRVRVLSAEAEDVVLSGQAHAVEYDGSRGGRCIQISQPGGAADFAKVPLDRGSESAPGEVRFELDVPNEGEYRVWCRIMWHCSCGVGMNLTTSGTTAETGSNESARGDSNVFSTTPPRVWHWVDCGRFKFEAGSATLSLRQRGHLALLDSIEVTSELAYRPAGYIDESESYRLEDPEEWEPHAGGVDSKSISDREWNDFDFDGAFLPVLQENKPGSFGLEFCRKDSGQSYRLTLKLSADGSTTAQLHRVESGAAVVLNESSKLAWDGEPLRLHIRMVREKISLELNGVPQFTVQDDAFHAGRLDLIAENLDRVSLLELDIAPVRVFEEHFTVASSAWEPLSGDWHSAIDDSKQGHVYLCGPSNSAVSIAPWNLGDDYTFSAGVQLLGGGSAGLAFDVVTLENYRSVVLKAALERDGQASVEIVEHEGGRRHVAWSEAVAASPDQWHSLSITRKSSSLTISLNDNTSSHIELPSLPAGRVGFASEDGAGAVFSTVRSLVPGEEFSQRFVFLPLYAERALAAWKKSSGLFTHAIHPERLMAVPAAGNNRVSLELRRPVPVGQRIAVEFYKNSAHAVSATTGGSVDLPSLPAIVLPTDPHVGIRLSSVQAGGDEYEICTNESGFSILEIRKNGKVFARESKRSPALSEHRMYVELYENRFIAGTESGILVEAPIEGGSWKDAQFNLSIFGENLTKDTPMGVVEITVAPCAIRISTTRK